jgi:pimeloyl-ACP methyl ester carboxylesterase
MKRNLLPALILALTLTAASPALATNYTQPPTVLTLVQTFNAPPAGQITGKDDASVLVHGWTRAPSYWSNDFRTSLNGALGTNTAFWDVWAFDWTQAAADSRPAIQQTAPTQVHELNAVLQGQYLAKTLLDQGSYDNIHLYGHSLGGRVVETAATILRQATSAPLQVTFLDAYTPYTWNLIYGSNSTWAEHIVNTDGLPDDTPAYTNSFFPNAYNIDVTAPRPPKPADWPSDSKYGHNWPRIWYKNTIDNYNPDFTKYAGLGYPTSMEFSLAGFPDTNNHPTGKVEHFTSNEDTLGPAGQLGGTKLTPISLVDFTSETNSPIKGKSSNNVYIDEADGYVLHMHAEPNTTEWCHIEYSTYSKADVLEFEFDFTTANDSMLSAYWDDDMVYAAKEKFALTNTWEDTGKISWRAETSNWSPISGTHTLSFRLDALAGAATDVKLRTIHTDALNSIPEPASGIAVLVCALAISAHPPRKRWRMSSLHLLPGVPIKDSRPTPDPF